MSDDVVVPKNDDGGQAELRGDGMGKQEVRVLSSMLANRAGIPSTNCFRKSESLFSSSTMDSATLFPPETDDVANLLMTLSARFSIIGEKSGSTVSCNFTNRVGKDHGIDGLADTT